MLKTSSMNRGRFSNYFLAAYRLKLLRRTILRIVLRSEGGEVFSHTLRDILKKYYGVIAGEYSYGEGLIPGKFPNNVFIGRYVSIAAGVKVFLRNHPMERISMHPFFYNSALGLVEKDNINFTNLIIDHDAWIGANAIVAASCNRIGIGSVVAGGSVVTKDVPDFAIVGGQPAKLIRYRFNTEEERRCVLNSKWWELDVVKISNYMDHFTTDFDMEKFKSLGCMD